MTVDVHLQNPDEDFLEDIEEIIEDTMIQMFFLHPQDEAAIHQAQALSLEYPSLFYTLPIPYADMCDDNCIGFTVDNKELLEHIDPKKPLFVFAEDLNESLRAHLASHAYRGIILNPTQMYDELSRFLLSFGTDNVHNFDPSLLQTLSMDRIVLHSSYPDNDFESITTTVKTISDALFRPEQSIIARATQNTLSLCGFKK